MSSFSFRRKAWTHKHWRLWVLLGAVSWGYQCKQIQEPHQETMVPSRQEFMFFFEPLTSLIPGLAIHMAREHNVPRIYMRLDWVQIIPRSKLREMILKGNVSLMEEIESGKISVNACDETGESLLSRVTLFIYRNIAVAGIPSP